MKLSKEQIVVISNKVYNKLLEPYEKRRKELYDYYGGLKTPITESPLTAEDKKNIKDYKELFTRINKKYKKDGIYNVLTTSAIGLEHAIKQRDILEKTKKLSDDLNLLLPKVTKQNIIDEIILSTIEGGITPEELINKLVKQFK